MDNSIISSLSKTVDAIKLRTNSKPRLGVILGSGLGAVEDIIQTECKIPFSEIPHFIPTNVIGHNGQLILGKIDRLEVAILQGRVHFYEGHQMSEIVYPVRTLAMLGIDSLLITNSAGGLNSDMSPGDFMVIQDHLNFMGDNPLKGPNLPQLGPRFPDMTEAYDPKLTSLLEGAFKELKLPYHKGVYAAVSGPTYETPAEVKMLKIMGGDAVGMSTVPEVIAANHLGLRVAALSCITNLAAGMSPNKLSHSEVTETASRVQASFKALIRSFSQRFAGALDKSP